MGTTSTKRAKPHASHKHTETVVGKDELVHQIAAQSGQTIKATQAMLKAFTEVVYRNLSEGEAVRLMGFGTWEIRHIKARTFRSIRGDGSLSTLPAGKRVGFQVGNVLAKVAKE